MQMGQNMRQDFFGTTLAKDWMVGLSREQQLTIGKISQLNPVRRRLRSLDDLEAQSLPRSRRGQGFLILGDTLSSESRATIAGRPVAAMTQPAKPLL